MSLVDANALAVLRAVATVLAAHTEGNRSSLLAVTRHRARKV